MSTVPSFEEFQQMVAKATREELAAVVEGLYKSAQEGLAYNPEVEYQSYCPENLSYNGSHDDIYEIAQSNGMALAAKGILTDLTKHLR